MTSAIYQKMDTSVGLSTIASLSLGLSMSMTPSGRAVICRNLGVPIPVSPHSSNEQRPGREPTFPCLPQPPRSAGLGGALQAGFAGPRRRTSFVGILHEMSAQNRLLLPNQQNAGRRLSFGDLERAPAVDELTTREDSAKQDGKDSGTRRRSSDVQPHFSVEHHDNTAPTSHAATDDVISSRDECEYTVNLQCTDSRYKSLINFYCVRIRGQSRVRYNSTEAYSTQGDLGPGLSGFQRHTCGRLCASPNGSFSHQRTHS